MGRTAKRVLDVVVAGLGLVILSPLMLLTAMLVSLFLARPVIYTQLRPGLKGKPFRIYKFRSMTDSRDVNGELLPNDQRLTRFGQILRATSLDELPELWNVLKGDMSLVGPRPLLMQYLPIYTAEQARRHDVLPGLTGWAQVHGRNEVEWHKRFAYDLWYVDNWSLWLDVRILALTFVLVLKKTGVVPKGQAHMSEFKGTKIDG